MPLAIIQFQFSNGTDYWKTQLFNSLDHFKLCLFIKWSRQAKIWFLMVWNIGKQTNWKPSCFWTNGKPNFKMFGITMFEIPCQVFKPVLYLQILQKWSKRHGFIAPCKQNKTFILITFYLNKNLSTIKIWFKFFVIFWLLSSKHIIYIILK